MIPDEAVEAAARMVYETSGRSRQMPYSAAEFACKLEAKKILEAAAPHLMAAAWDEGYMFSYDQERGGHGVGAIPIPEYLADDLAHWNPYRKAPDA